MEYVCFDHFLIPICILVAWYSIKSYKFLFSSFGINLAMQ
jgi:hypothetical protein